MKLNTKLALVCGIPMVGLVLAIGSSYQLSRTTNRAIVLAKDESAVFAAIAHNMQLSIVQVQQYLTDISATRGQDGLDDGIEKAEEARKAFLDGLSRFETMYRQEGNTKALGKVAKLAALFNRYYEEGRAMASSYVKHDTTVGNQHMGDFDKAATDLAASLQPFIEEQISELKNALAGVEISSSLANRAMLWGGLVLLVVSGGMGVGFARSISRPVKTVADSLLIGAEQTSSAAAQVS